MKVRAIIVLLLVTAGMAAIGLGVWAVGGVPPGMEAMNYAALAAAWLGIVAIVVCLVSSRR